MSAWHAIFTKPQKEITALAGIKALGVPVWFPWRLAMRWTPEGRIRRVKVPYFERYLFTDIEGFAHVSVKVNGVEAILGDVAIDPQVMGDLMARTHETGRIKEPSIKPGDVFPLIVGRSRLAAEFVAEGHQQVKAIIPLFGASRQVIVSRLYLSCPVDHAESVTPRAWSHSRSFV